MGTGRVCMHRGGAQGVWVLFLEPGQCPQRSLKNSVSQPPFQALALRPGALHGGTQRAGGCRPLGDLIAGALPKETQVIHQLYGESLLFTHSPHSKDRAPKWKQAEVRI